MTVCGDTITGEVRVGERLAGDAGAGDLALLLSRCGGTGVVRTPYHPGCRLLKLKPVDGDLDVEAVASTVEGVCVVEGLDSVTEF